CLRLRHTFRSNIPPNGIRKSSSSNEPFPPSGEIPKIRSKKSMQVSRQGTHLPRELLKFPSQPYQKIRRWKSLSFSWIKGVNQFIEAGYRDTIIHGHCPEASGFALRCYDASEIEHLKRCPVMTENVENTRALLRHLLATLAYRAAKVLRDVP